MSHPILLSVLTIPPPMRPLERLQALILFYIKMVILTPIAVIWNKTYVLRHPENPIPTIIISPWSQDIYAYSVTSQTRDYLIRKYPYLLNAIINHPPHSGLPIRPRAALFIEGDWHGPLLYPGIVIFYKRELLYVLSIPTSTPSYPPVQTAAIISLRTNTLLSLLSPQKFVNRYSHDDHDLLYASTDSIFLSNTKVSSFLDV